MKRSRLLASILALVALTSLAVACGDGDTTVVNDSTGQSGLSVSGRGEVEITPDTGFFNVGVEVRAATVAEARGQAAEAADAVVSSLTSNGVDEDDIKTSNFSIYPQFDYSRDDEPRITGYTVSNNLNVKVRELDDFSTIIDDAVEAGGNDARVSGISFDLEDREAAIEQARELAWDDATRRAEQNADLGGVSLGAPISIVDTFSNGGNPIPFDGRESPSFNADDAGFDTPIQPGTTSIVVNISVVFAIE